MKIYAVVLFKRQAKIVSTEITFAALVVSLRLVSAKQNGCTASLHKLEPKSPGISPFLL